MRWTYSAIFVASNRTGHGCSAVVSRALAGSSPGLGAELIPLACPIPPTLWCVVDPTTRRTRHGDWSLATAGWGAAVQRQKRGNHSAATAGSAARQLERGGRGDRSAVTSGWRRLDRQRPTRAAFLRLHTGPCWRPRLARWPVSRHVLQFAPRLVA